MYITCFMYFTRTVISLIDAFTSTYRLIVLKDLRTNKLSHTSEYSFDNQNVFGVEFCLLNY